MHDPEFEKEVQKKMEELEFTPSEGVWMNLQRGLHKTERRRAPLFWLFFLLGGILLGAGGASLFYFHRSASANIEAGAAGKTETLAATASPALAGATTRTSGTAVSGKTGFANARSGNARSANASSGNASSENARSGNAGSGNASSENASGNAVSANANDRSFFAATTGAISEQEEGGYPSAAHRSVDAHRTVVAPMRLSLHKDLISADIFYQPGRSLPDPKYRNGLITAIPAATMNKRSAKKARFSTHPSWEAGFAGGGGFSSAVIPGSSSSPAANSATGVSTLVFSLQSLPSSGGQVQLRISKIQPDLSFWAGIFVQRPVMKRLSFMAGLNLHYYSTRLETVEQKSPSSLSTPGSPAVLFNPSPYVQPAAQSSPYYAPESYKFSNRYYFLQIPLSLQWQVNRSRKTPVFWEGGLALSRLISANALYYNEKSGMYYKDGGAANPNHLMAFSSLMVGLTLRGNSIKIGPEGQYGLTSLINTGNVGSQHLYYGGIKITVIPRKW
jgi:hypothetical protein